MKVIISIGLCLLLIGCTYIQVDVTEDLCGIMKHSPSAQNKTVYMDGKVCVLESRNHSYAYTMRCSTLTEKVTMILKTQKKIPVEDVEQFSKEMKKVCKIEVLE